MSLLRSLFRLPPRLNRRARRSRIRTMLTLLTVLFLFFASLYFVYKPPAILFRYFRWRWPDVLWNVQTDKKIVALTIDDVPSQHTAEIREILKLNDAKATFFVIGSQVEDKDSVLRDLIGDGHELGNHAWRDEPSVRLPPGKLVEQIRDVEAIIAHAYLSALGPREDKSPPPFPRYFRPGSGFFSTRMRASVASLGYQLVLGDIFPHDPAIPYPGINARHVLSMLHPGGIIICHDRRSWTAPMLRAVLPEITAKGYRVVTLTELLRETREDKNR